MSFQFIWRMSRQKSQILSSLLILCLSFQKPFPLISFASTLIVIVCFGVLLRNFPQFNRLISEILNVCFGRNLRRQKLNQHLLETHFRDSSQIQPHSDGAFSRHCDQKRTTIRASELTFCVIYSQCLLLSADFSANYSLKLPYFNFQNFQHSASKSAHFFLFSWDQKVRFHFDFCEAAI